MKEKRSKLADEIVAEWQREKELKRLSERKKKGRDEDVKPNISNRQNGNN